MQPQPIYNPTTSDGAYQLRYSWTGWPSVGRFDSQPLELIEATKAAWQRDQLRVLEYRWTPELVQILFSVTPEATPEFLAARAKGRLDHALREAGVPQSFSRKVAVRAVGDNTRRDVEAYIDRQVDKERFADARFTRRMQEMLFVDPQVDLSQPAETARGRYWCNLHLVLVVERHARIHDVSLLELLRDNFLKIAAKKRHAVSRLTVMQDHLHAALRGGTHETPLEVVFAYQNNLAYLSKQTNLWSRGYYVGTFGEYGMQAVRNSAMEPPK